MSEAICPTCEATKGGTFAVGGGVKSQKGFCRFCMSTYLAEFDEAGCITNLVHGDGAISTRLSIRDFQSQIDNLKAELSDVDQLRAELAAIRKERDVLLFQNAAGLANAETFLAIVHWLETDPIKPASQAFTAGPERQIAYMIERDVLSMLQGLREENNNLKAEVDTLHLALGIARVAPK